MHKLKSKINEHIEFIRGARSIGFLRQHFTGEKTKEDIGSIHRLNRFLVNPNRMSRRGSRLMGKLGLSQFEDKLKDIRDKYQNNNPNK